MLRRFVLVGAFVVFRQGSVEQLAYATFTTQLYLAIQMMASPFRSRTDDFMAAMCSLSLAALFVLCLLYKLGALTQLSNLQEVMSLELRSAYLVPYISFSGILWATCMSAFFVLAAITASLARST